jgi:hypothetical protein
MSHQEFPGCDRRTGDKEGGMKNGWEPGGFLYEALSELSVAVTQTVPSDDQIIMDHVREARRFLNAARLKAIDERDELDRAYENSSPYFNLAIRNFRAQAASVTGETGKQLRECLDVADELAEEERVNRIIVAREGSL